MGGRPNFNHPFARAVIERVKESLVVYQQRMKGVVTSVSADGKSAVVRRYEESEGVVKKAYVNTVAGLQVGDEVVCMVDRGGGVITGVVGGKGASGGGGAGHVGPLASTSGPTSYPAGVTVGRTSGTGWPTNGVVVTFASGTYFRQIVYPYNVGDQYHRYSNDGTTWNSFLAK